MSQRLALILTLLILASAGTYFWWRNQAEKQIERQVDLFIETVEFRKLSLTQTETRHQAYRDLFSSIIEVSVPDPAPSGQYSLDEIIEELDRFHAYISYFEIEESSRKIALDGETAEIKIPAIFQIAFGPNSRNDLNGTLELFFEKEDAWRIVGISVTAE